MSNCQHIGIVVISTYHLVFMGPNYDAGVGLGVGVDFLLCLNSVSPSYSKTHSRVIPQFRSVCVEKGVVVMIISRFKLSCACAITWTCSSLCLLIMSCVYFRYFGLVHIGVGNENLDEGSFSLGQVRFLYTGLIWKIFKLEFLYLYVSEIPSLLSNGYEGLFPWG
jgi:hypothetical protein